MFKKLVSFMLVLSFIVYIPDFYVFASDDSIENSRLHVVLEVDEVRKLRTLATNNSTNGVTDSSVLTWETSDSNIATDRKSVV